jgi:LuxR family transcriptional regulator, maltose regulon positive regulatory protein
VATQLLETKLYVPKVRRSLVARPRLVERMSRGAESKLTLISAPAGFGKTTILTEWLAATAAAERSAAWLSLDQDDNQSAPFWTYLITALQVVAPTVGANALSLLQEPQPPPIEGVLTTVLNELAALPNDIVLVLDDYHAIDAPDIQGGMAFLLEHLSTRVHLVITTRADPALPLARLRARGELVEIRAADLRFTPDEADAYLNGMMGLDLAAQDVAALERRTEGWIAALQLAALSIQGRDDIAGFIAGFAGDDRYIVDYLVEEVLQRQPEQVRTFLLDTSILDRLTGQLCDAVTGHDGGKSMLEALDRANLFLVPLDDRRRWYRYHQLFADVLRARLLDEQPDRVPDLHRRASVWYEQNSDRSEAIRHAMAGEDFERAAELVELAIPAMSQGRQEATLRRWLDAIPDGLFEARPVLAVGYVAARLVSGEIEGVEARLRQAERWLEPSAQAGERSTGRSTDMIVVDEAAFRRLPGSIAMYRTALALAFGDVAGTISHARRVLDVIGEDDHLERGGAAGFLGLAYWTLGDLAAAHRSWTEAAASLQNAGHVSDAIGCSIALADIRIAQGRLSEAMRTYERGIAIAAQQPAPSLRGVPDMHVGISELFRERNDLTLARQHLMLSDELGERAGLAQNAYRWRVAMAHIQEAEGDLDAALGSLDEAERLYKSDYYPNVRPIPAMKARIWTAQGRLSEALGWAREHRVSVEDDLSYLREFEHITLARVFLALAARDRAGGSAGEALQLLGRLVRAAEAGERTGAVIEILVLLALAYQLRDEIPAALTQLERALALAEREGYVRTFVDEGRPMAALLEGAARHQIAPSYVRPLLAALGKPGDSTNLQQALVEPLTERELEVLRLLGTELAGPDIARELVVSLSTIRSHTKNIYAKLGVNTRRAAVRRGEELDLLSRVDRRQRPVIVHDS